MRIVFMGTPGFAVASLKALVESKHQVVGVITATDKAAGRGKKIRFSAVKDYALEQEIPLLQPPNLKKPAFHEELAAMNADLFVVVAFRMLPEVVWSMPPKGTINLHGSLLPAYRGAAPINWAVINGETESGVSTFFIQQEIDTGPMIEQRKVAIGPNDTAGDLHDRLMVVGASLIVETVDRIETGNAPSVEQDHSLATKSAPKIHKEDCLIDWAKPSEQVRNHIRGLSPYPAAYTEFEGKRCKIFIAELSHPCTEIAPGTSKVTNTELLFACNDRWLSIRELQMEGKRRMKVGDWRRGYSKD